MSIVIPWLATATDFFAAAKMQFDSALHDNTNALHHIPQSSIKMFDLKTHKYMRGPLGPPKY